MISGENQPIIVQESYKDDESKVASHLQNDNANKEQQQKLKKWQRQQQHKEKQNMVRVVRGIELDDERFFKVMDLVDGYDKLLKEMSEQYSAGMLLIANVKFTNPYTSLSTKGYKPTPAITKLSCSPISQQSRPLTQLLTLTQQTKSLKFTNSVIDSINREIQLNKDLDQEDGHEEEMDTQSAHSSMSTANQIYSYEEEELIMEEQQCVDECRKVVESWEGEVNMQEFMMERFSLSTQKSIVSEASVRFSSLLKKLLQLASYKMHILTQFDKIQNSLSSN